MSCSHDEFEVEGRVARITEHQDGDEPYAFVLEVSVRCAACDEPFGFRGMEPGFSFARPTRDVEATKASLPLLTPAELAFTRAAGNLPGMTEDPPVKGPAPSFTILDASTSRDDRPA